jgi:hypothetical protein
MHRLASSHLGAHARSDSETLLSRAADGKIRTHTRMISHTTTVTDLKRYYTVSAVDLVAERRV